MTPDSRGEHSSAGQLPPAIVMLPEPDHHSTGLGLVRCLGRKGVPVVTGSSSRCPMSAQSRYVRQHFVLPPMGDSTTAYLEALVEKARGLAAKPVLFVSCDEQCVIVNEHADLLRDHLTYSYLSAAALHKCIDKGAMHRAAADAGVPAPATVLVTSRAEADEALAVMRYPCVVKPASWVQTSGDRCRRNSGFIPTFGEKAVRAASREDLASMMLAALQLSTPVVVQQEIIGDCADNWGLSLYASQSGDIWVGPALRKTRQYPPDFGTGCCMVPTSEPRIAEISSKFVSALGFHGVADIDIKRDQATDEFYLIEINPRPGACITAASANGTNTPYIAYCDLVGLPVPVPREPEQKVIWVDAWPDTMHFVRYRRSGPMGRRLSWTAWRRSVRSPREGAFYTADDPLPGLRRGLDLSFALARGACRRLVRAVRRPADK